MHWLKRLFGMSDRVSSASDRIAASWENMAEHTEQLEAIYKQRFALPENSGQPAIADIEPTARKRKAGTP